MASLLEKTANAFIIAACTVVVGQYGYRLTHKPPHSDPAFSPGAHVRAAARLELSSAPRTLIMVTTSTCPYCNASMPFYKQVAELAHKTGTRIVAITQEAPRVNRTFLESHGIAVESALSQSDSGLQVMHTPTLILLRRDGTIIDSWVGQPRDERAQQSIMKALRKT